VIGQTKLLISSYSYRWAMGSRQYRPAHPMPITEFLKKAHHHGLGGVQIVDNVNPERLTNSQVAEIFTLAQKLQLELEWGFDGWEQKKIHRLLEISSASHAGLLRGVFGRETFPPGLTREERVNKAVAMVKELLAELEKRKIILAIENHFDLKTNELRKVMETFDHPLIRVCLDTTNALGEIERPLETLDSLGKYAVSLHLKDFKVSKVIGGYTIMVTPIGEGEQDCPGILREALRLNPGMEVCLELASKPDDEVKMLEIEELTVKTSVENIKKYLHNICSKNDKSVVFGPASNLGA
jgi:sugar phosphate isomerase/epimerase